MKLTRCGSLKVLGLWTSNPGGLDAISHFFFKVEGMENSLRVDATTFAEAAAQVADGRPVVEVGLYLEDE